ncbi:MAG: minor capsid protein [Treponema sp.]|nr:minor capsid protein [Treponema sp.]
MVAAIERLIGSSYMLGLIHAEEENPERKIDAADETEIPEIPFNEAMQFLKSKVPMSKAEWKSLEPKLRFRAFTVAQLGSAELVDKAKQILLKSFEKGGGTYSDTWEELKKKVNVNALGIKPGYWENVFRTNTQSAYIAGKLQQYDNSNVAAYQLMVIEDGRTSRICRHLLTASGYGMIISVDHLFWKKYGFPPYHFQCRTSIRAIWPSQVGKLGNMVENPTMKSLSKFKVQEGFGGNPLDKESWWRMTDNMAFRAAEYGLWEVIEKQAKDNSLHNFALDLVDGSNWRKLQGTTFKAEKAKMAEPLQKEVNLAKILTEKGHSWYFTPENHNVGIKNPDGIFDGKIADMKILTSRDLDKISERILECDKQKVRLAIIHVTDTSAYSQKDAISAARETLKKSLDFVKEVILVYGNKISCLK